MSWKHGVMVPAVLGLTLTVGTWGIAQQPKTSETLGEKVEDVVEGIKRSARTTSESLKEEYQKVRASVHDMGVQSRIYSRLHWDKDLNNSKLELEFKEGTVTLHGTVKSLVVKAKAAELARDTVGVDRVDDHLTIEPAAPVLEPRPAAKTKSCGSGRAEKRKRIGHRGGQRGDDPLHPRPEDRADSPRRSRPRQRGESMDSNDDGVDDSGELAPGVGQTVEVVLAGPPRLDQPAMPEQGQVMADGGLALRAEVGAELGNVSFLLVQEHQDLEARGIGDLLEQVGHPANLLGGALLGGLRAFGRFTRSDCHVNPQTVMK